MRCRPGSGTAVPCIDEVSSICRHHEREDRGGQVHVPWWAGVRRDAAGPRTVARSDMRRIGLACPDIASNRRDRDDHNEGGEARFHWLPRRATDPLVMVRHAMRASSTDIGFGDASSEVTAATPAGPEFLNAANDSSTPESTPFILSNPVRIAVVSNVGNLNLGDEAILRSTLQALRNRLPNASIRVYTISPAEAAERHGVDTAPLRSRVTERPAGQSHRAAHPLRTVARSIPVVAPILGAAARLIRAAAAAAREPGFIVRSWRGLRGADLLLVAGSNQLEDWFGGPRGYPYTLLLWTILARLVGAPVAFVSVGAGPLNSGLSRWMCVRAVRLATYVSFRDAESLGLMRRLGYHRGGIVVPDLAFGLALEDPRARPSGASLRMGVNVFPYRDPRYDPHVRDGGAAFCRYLDGIAGVVAGARQRGMQPVLFGMQRADEPVLDLVQERLRARAPELGDVERRMPPTLADVIALIDGCDVLVATRYHGILLRASFMAGRRWGSATSRSPASFSRWRASRTMPSRRTTCTRARSSIGCPRLQEPIRPS